MIDICDIEIDRHAFTNKFQCKLPKRCKCIKLFEYDLMYKKYSVSYFNFLIIFLLSIGTEILLNWFDKFYIY